MVGQVPVGLMSVPNCMVGGFGVVGAVALVGAVLLIRAGGWAGWLFGVFAAIVAIAGLGFLGFALWGRFTGYPFGFAAV